MFEEFLKDLAGMDKREKLRYFIELGQDLDDMEKDQMVAENKVTGCVSNVYISASLTDEGKMNYVGCSEAMIVRGLVFVLVDVLSGLTPQQVLDAEEDVIEFAELAGVDMSMVPSRANAFGNMYRLMKQQAAAMIE